MSDLSSLTLEQIREEADRRGYKLVRKPSELAWDGWPVGRMGHKLLVHWGLSWVDIHAYSTDERLAVQLCKEKGFPKGAKWKTAEKVLSETEWALEDENFARVMRALNETERTFIQNELGEIWRPSDKTRMKLALRKGEAKWGVLDLDQQVVRLEPLYRGPSLTMVMLLLETARASLSTAEE